MTERLPVFFGGIALGFGLTLAGGWPFRLLAAALWLGMILETSLAASRSLLLPFRKYLWLDLLFFGSAPILACAGGLPAVVLMGLAWVLVLFLIFPPDRAGLARWLFSSVVQPYIAAGVFSFFLLREIHWVWPVIALSIVVVADTAAYLIGRRLGALKLAPGISPAKTVEGAAAGIVLSSAVAAALLIRQTVPVPTSILVSLGLAILAVLGDLFESFLKRGLDIKDFGVSLPGHGGLFDRLDSLLPVSMGLFLFVKLS